ncbi:CpaF family protein [Candidatus Omnitrophota bacterium]
MGLKDRLERLDQIKGSHGKKSAKKEHVSSRSVFDNYKVVIHKELLEKLDLKALNEMNEEKARAAVKDFVEDLIEEKQLPLNQIERIRLVKELEDETFGYGPIEPLLTDYTVDEILINGPGCVYIEKFGRIEKSDIKFRDELHLRTIIDRIVSRVGRRVDESSPMVDARLPDGSRVNVIIPPLALNGSTVSIRKFKKSPLLDEDLLRFGSATPEIITFAQLCVKCKMNVLISGGTGTGKTTILNILSSYIPVTERIVTIEDAAELQLQQPHVVRLETRPPNIEGKGAVTQRELVKNSLRMRPDRIIVGEVRGGEALDMLQAMNTGHEGSLTTVHANSPRDALSRIEMMVGMSNVTQSPRAVYKQMSSAFHIIMQITRYSDGVRRLSSVTEVTGMEGDVITLQEIFKFNHTGVSNEGKVIGSFEFTGVRPKCYDNMKAKGLLKGVELPFA